MENLVKFIKDLFTREFHMRYKDGDEVWSQPERNKLRTELIAAFIADFQAAGIEALRTQDGIATVIPHDEYGSIVVTWSPKMHGLNYDVYESASEYQEKLEKSNEKK